MKVVLKFRDFEIDEMRCEVRRNGLPVAVQPRVFDTILFLVKRCNRLVTKEELIAGPWDGSAVSDAALSRAIMQARRTLSDDDSSVIRTVHKKGFRFESLVTVESTQPVSRQVSKRRVVLEASPALVVPRVSDEERLALLKRQRERLATLLRRCDLEIEAAVGLLKRS